MGSFNKSFEDLTVGDLKRLHTEYLELQSAERLVEESGN